MSYSPGIFGYSLGGFWIYVEDLKLEEALVHGHDLMYVPE